MATMVASSLGFTYSMPSTHRAAPLTMEEYIADVPFPLLDVEEMLIQQRGCRPVPFPGMDKSGRGVCVRNEQGTCQMGAVCPLRHIVGDKAVVCKHWLRGLCKKGDQCEFLHEYDLSKMPECFFFSKYMACSNRECPFRHIDPESKIKDCPWYDRGFCRHGPYCKHRHRRRVLCPSYLAGFCPEGPNCKYAHPSFNLPPIDSGQGMRNRGPFNAGIICHNCHERGHKATFCPHLPTQNQPLLDSSRVNQQMPAEPVQVQLPDKKALSEVTCYKATFCPHLPTQNQPLLDSSRVNQQMPAEPVQVQLPDKKALSEVTCYKCGEKGHYANRCHKGVLAFLSNTAHLAHEQRERDEKEGRLNNQAFFGAVNRPPPPVQSPSVLNKSGDMSHPSHYVSFDRTMQELVYKLVPGLQAREEEYRNAFANVIKKQPVDGDPLIKIEEVESSPEKKDCSGDVMRNHHRADEQLVVELCTDKLSKFDNIPMPIVRLSAMATVNTIKRYLALVLLGDMGRYNELDIFCNNELMGRDFSMKFIEKTRWRNKPKEEPIQLIFRKHIDF
ncbi:Cleavage and polyadenylation specificity factor subunit 4 [Toxocara canis]|uniref:Cleavage and polyadenylation specificity factor subunit 4 n=1 Tax=Toxocara canis TaxID=6265 RepID=A0A0B2VT26_TOXCA|nr:Cleavage and polyadenylation specificity factor subunit 4 [Toxocara canis]